MSNATMLNNAQALLDSMTPKFAVSYLRVSTRGQAERGGGHDEGFSIPAQREANKRKAATLGAIVGKEFVDRGASAKSADRPQLQAMLEYVKENADRIDYVNIRSIVSHVTVTMTATLCAYCVSAAFSLYPHLKVSMILRLACFFTAL